MEKNMWIVREMKWFIEQELGLWITDARKMILLPYFEGELIGLPFPLTDPVAFVTLLPLSNGCQCQILNMATNHDLLD